MRSLYILLVIVGIAIGAVAGIAGERWRATRQRDSVIAELTELNEQRADNEQRLTTTIEQQRERNNALETSNIRLEEYTETQGSLLQELQANLQNQLAI